MESGVVDGGCDALFPFSHAGLVPIGVFYQGDMYKGNIHVSMGVSIVVLLQVRMGLFKPVNLIGLDPVVAREMTLIGGVRMRVEEVDCQGGVVVVATGQDFDVVVADAVDVCGAGLREGVREGFHESHLGFSRHGLFVVVVAKDGGVGYFALDEERSVFVYSLSFHFIQGQFMHGAFSLGEKEKGVFIPKGHQEPNRH